MRRAIFFTVIGMFLVQCSILFAQPWKANLPENERNFRKIQAEFNKQFGSFRPERGNAGEEPEEEMEEENWMLYKRWEWFWEPRVSADGNLPAPDILQTRMQEYERTNPQKSSMKAAGWTLIGPSVVPSNEGGAGRLNCIAIHPNNNNIIFVGAASGGLWKTTNGGSTWTTNTDGFASMGVSAIVFNPTDPNIMYIATGDGDAGDTYSIGVLKSTDGGTTWNTTGLNYSTSNTTTIRDLVIHPTDGNILLAATSGGVYRSTNGGAGWSSIVSGSFFDIEVNKSDPTVWYASRSSSGVYKSTNTGSTFTQLTGGGLPTSGFGRIAIAIAESSPATIYALYVNGSSGFYGLYRSTNSGTNWTQQSNTPNILSWSGSETNGQGWYDLVLDVNPQNPAMVYVGGVNLYKSTTSGSSWTKITHWYSGAGYPYIHADQHAFAFDPANPSIVFAGNDGGIFKSTNNGSSWSDLSGGLAIAQFYRLGVSQTNVNRIYAGAQDNGTDRVLNGNWSQILGGDGMEALIDYTDENIGYGELYYGDIYRTTNGGASFSYISSTFGGNGGWVTPYVINPVNPRSLYVGTTRVYKTTNRGDTWSTISSSLTGSTLVSLAVAKSDTNRIYAADYTSVYTTTNGGTTWTNISSGLPSASKTYIAVHPNDALTAYITISGYGSQKVFKTTNGGSSWTNISSGLPSIPVNCVAIHPTSTNNIFVGTDVGAYSSADGGATWQSFSVGLPNVIVNELEFNTANNKLRAATYGRGIWETAMGSGTGSISGTVFFDANNNGIVDAGDAGLHQWMVRISGAKTDSQLTTLNGTYSFASIEDGQYTVTFEQKSGWTLKSPLSGSYVLNVTDGTTHTGKNFVNYFPGTFENFESGTFPPSGWSSRLVAGDSGWKSTTLTPHSGTTAAYSKAQTAGTDGSKMLISKRVALSVGNKELRFRVKRGSTADLQPDTLLVKISTTDSLPASFATTLFKCYSGDTTSGDTNVYSTRYKEYVVSLNAFSGPVYLAFDHRDNGGQNLYLDDIMINVGSVGPVFSATPSPMMFGGINVNATKRDTLTITNIGSSTMNITSISSSNSTFLVSPSIGTIGSFASKKFIVTFFPTSAGVKTANLVFTSNTTNVTDTVQVNGIGVAPLFAKDSSTATIGKVRVGQSATDSVIVTNTGTAQLNVTSVTSSDTQFVVSPTSVSLAPSASQTFFITYSPAAAGTDVSNIYFTHNATGSPGLVIASGTGVVPGFNASLDELTFGKKNIGENKTDSVEISNFGGATLSIASVQTTGAQFVVEPTSAVIEPDSSKWFTVTFTPDMIGQITSELIFTHDAVSSPDTVILTGRGADTLKLRTFKADTALYAKPAKIKVTAGKPAVKPNTANWRDTVVYRFDKRKGVTVGLLQTGSAAGRYGWIRFGKGTDVSKFFKTTQTNPAYNAPFDTIRKESTTKSRKKFVRELHPTSEAYTNPLVQAFTVFKLNLYSSKLGITPKGLDSLVYVSAGSRWDGMTLSQIANRVDSVMTKYNEVALPGGVFATVGIAELEELRTLLNSINNAFVAPIALANGDSIVTGQGLKFAGMVGLHTVPFLDKQQGAKIEPLNLFTQSDEEPTEFILHQNYPNPFNPTTTFGFTIAEAGFVSLKVYDVLGREVATLIHEQMDIGTYETSWDATGEPSGVYFYRLTASPSEEGGTKQFTAVKKLLLMK